ncbi:hypothetical protein L6164_029076 [Bauhinia variegata]|uniref:Uncharacterized protein n=1 Tax=Bauhinia variegata TaxID=167791 RepID=A0ACB9L9G4_BAUVA|nr:hypothetical protein L6164_029076 [Bauhinia variegata]
MAYIMISLVSVLVLCISAAEGRKTLHPINGEADGICKTLVERQGYTCEEHTVTTDDGYILSLQRMPAAQSGMKANKSPVLLQHGIISDAISWLFNHPNESLAFILADNGYEVWLVNTRGTRYSNQHRSLSPDDKAYWDWSWDQLTAYDLPASVQYVNNNTGQKLHFVGHSLGTLIALSALSQDKVLDSLSSAALLSPIAYLDKISSHPTKIAADIFLGDVVYWLGLRKFNPIGDGGSKLLEHMCNLPFIKCKNLFTLFTGPNCCINLSTIDVFLNHHPQPTSTKNLIHLAQMIRSGKIAMYDYGDQEQNMAHYGQASPPLYDMTRIPNDFPLFLSYGGQDTLSDVKDVQVLLDNLKDHDKDKLVVAFMEDYAHMDFVMGVNAKQVLYDNMMAFFDQA